MTPTDTLIAALCVAIFFFGLCVGYWLAWFRYGPPLPTDEDPEQYNVPDPRIIAINREIERAQKRHQKVSHLYAERTRICHEGLKA